MCAKKVLVTYATKYGATEEIAGLVARTLTDAGLDIDLVPVMEVGKIDDYDAIIIGSPVYMGKILVEAREFCKQYKPYLEGKWIAFFVDGISPCKNDKKSMESMIAAIDEMLQYIVIDEKATFGGKLDFGLLIEADMQIASIAKAPEGDFSNPEEIRAWATVIAQEIAQL